MDTSRIEGVAVFLLLGGNISLCVRMYVCRLGACLLFTYNSARMTDKVSSRRRDMSYKIQVDISMMMFVCDFYDAAAG